MAYREVKKNSSETVRISARRYQGHDLIDVRIFARTREGEITATRKGVSLNVDQIPDLIECLEWALQQACDENPDRTEEDTLSSDQAELLAAEAHGVLSKHGLPVHWDLAESMVLERPGMAQFTKWQLHYVLATRRDLFIKEDTGCFRAL